MVGRDSASSLAQLANYDYEHNTMRCFAIPAGLLLLAIAAPAEDWHVVRPNHRPYVSFANVAQFYQFAGYTRVSRTVSLRSERRTIRAKAGTSELSINGVKFWTYFPLLNGTDEDLISVMDVSKIIEPVLRPSRIQNSQKVDTVVLDPGHGGFDNGASSRSGNEKIGRASCRERV